VLFPCKDNLISEHMWNPDCDFGGFGGDFGDYDGHSSDDCWEAREEFLDASWYEFMEDTVYQVSHEVIASLGIDHALVSNQPYMYLTGLSELACIYARLQSLSIGAQRTSTLFCRPKVLFDLIALAIEHCDGTHLSVMQLIKLLDKVRADHKSNNTVILPKKRQEALLALMKKKMIALNRQQRKADNLSQESDKQDETTIITLDMLPDSIITHIFRFLDPMSLAKAAAVNKHWQQLSRTDALWKPLCQALVSNSLTNDGDQPGYNILTNLEKHSGKPYHQFFNTVVGDIPGRECLAMFWSCRVLCVVREPRDLEAFFEKTITTVYRPLPDIPGGDLSAYNADVHKKRLNPRAFVDTFLELLFEKHKGGVDGEFILEELKERDGYKVCDTFDIEPFAKSSNV